MSLGRRLREGNEVRGSLILVGLERRAVQVLWAESSGQPRVVAQTSTPSGDLDLIFVRDVSIHTMENVRSRTHDLSATSRATLRETVCRVPLEPRVAWLHHLQLWHQ